MAKTVMIAGDNLTPAYLNALNGVDANTGIIHDGADTDGHAPKIDIALAAEVTGVLPNANMSQIDLSTSQITGVLPAVNVAQIPLTTGVSGQLPSANIADGIGLAKLTNGASGTISVLISTTYLTVQQTATINWERVGNRVNLHFGPMSGTSNSTEMQLGLNGDTWPSAIQVGSTTYQTGVLLTDNGNAIPGLLQLPVASTGSLMLHALSSGSYAYNNFTNTGTKGINIGSITYLVV